MSPLIRGLTIGLLFLPVVLVGVALLQQNGGLVGVALLLVLLYAGVWLGWRPVCCQVTARELAIVFPVWQRLIPLTTITNIRLLGQHEFQIRCGSALRVGVGGLWGGFGGLWTSRAG